MVERFKKKIKLVIFDFDGTATNVEIEGVPYMAGYLADIGDLCGLTADRVQELARQFVELIAANPDQYGWAPAGIVVAPANVDPLLRVVPISKMILQEAGIVLPVDFLNRLLTKILYKYNYRKTVDSFREGAGYVFRRAAEVGAVYVVTNSDPDVVKGKIGRLYPANPDGDPVSVEWLTNNVRGFAKKFEVIPESVPGVAATMRISGLDREVQLQRPHYYKTLEEIRVANGCEWDEMMVVGDIFELDLVLPSVLGANVLHIVNSFTPTYELDYVGSLPNGRSITQFTEVLNYLG